MITKVREGLSLSDFKFITVPGFILLCVTCFLTLEILIFSNVILFQDALDFHTIVFIIILFSWVFILNNFSLITYFIIRFNLQQQIYLYKECIKYLIFELITALLPFIFLFFTFGKLPSYTNILATLGILIGFTSLIFEVAVFFYYFAMKAKSKYSFCSFSFSLENK